MRGVGRGIARGVSGLVVLATSREPLSISGEAVFRVPSLGLDNGGKPGEAAAALAVRHHLICHQINVIRPRRRTGSR